MNTATGVRDLRVSLAERIARSAMALDSPVTPNDEFHDWWAGRAAALRQQVTRIPFAELGQWSFDPATGNLGHASGRYFLIEGLHVRSDYGPVPQWSQPIIHQPEIGILGILVREFDGVLHCLMQAKTEPGNCNDLQLSPTVQATRSNYTQVHGGRAVPYLRHFREARPEQIIADVLQSEQGSWFFRKRNRNMIVEIDEDVPVGEDFRWVTIGQLHRLLNVDNLVNMDSRTVLSCLPFSGPGLGGAFSHADDDWAVATVRSLTGERAQHTTGEIMSWITDCQSRHEVVTRLVPLNQVERWHREDDAISHEEGRYFSVIAVDVEARGREIAAWRQPLLEPHGLGLAAFLARRIDDVLHVLVNARVEPGYLDVVELAPTVQCTPDSYRHRPAHERPAHLDTVLNAPRESIRYDTVLSEEGGRFYRAESRYVVVEPADDVEIEETPDHRWMTLDQLADLLRHSHYVNVQARTLVTGLRGAW
nr:NDP-hexose 2,3-dehydratase family protein [Dactylosporangium thailandense]